MSDCIFCKIASGEVPGKTVYSDEHVVVFPDIHPQAPTHLLVIPREHVEGVASLVAKADLVNRIFGAIAKIARDGGIEPSGYRVCLNQGKDAGQVVPHIHFHVLSGRKFDWPPG